jgi:hypothetical protein
MSAVGILDAAYVVFYHPLDNFTEYTQGQVWTGSGGFVAGKVAPPPPDAFSAVTADAPSFGAVVTVAAGGATFRNSPVRQAALSATKAVVVWTSRLSAGGDGNSYGAVATVSGTSVAFGAAAMWKSNTLSSNYLGARLAALDSTHVVVCYAKSTGGGFMKVGTVSGTDLTWGAEQQYHTLNLNGENTVVALDSTHVVVAYREGSITGHGKAKAGLVSGEAITFGAEVTWNATNNHWENGSIAMTALTATTFVLAHADGDSSVVGTVSGTDITLGSACATGIASSHVDVAALSPTKVVLISAVSGARVAAIGTVSGADITWGAASTFYLCGAASWPPFVAALGSDTFVVSYRANCSASRGQARLGTISGTDITWGAASAYNAGDSLETFVSKLTATSFLHTWLDFGGGTDGAAKAAVGELATTATMTAPTPGAYPTAIGATRVAAAMWAKKLTGAASTVTVERGYKIDMTPTTISLGGTTAVWSGAGIAALMASLNDGLDHLLVLDFENTAGTTWLLRTSLDGAPWISQGTQTSGTQVVATTNTAPKLEIAAGEAGQWIDELVLWVGDKAAFALFASDELANLQDLADVFGAPMNQYEEYFGAPICWQATARMPDGSSWRDSGCGPCPPVVRVPRGATDVVVTDDGTAASPRIVEG